MNSQMIENRGPELLRLTKERELTTAETEELAEIKKNCPCRSVDRNMAHTVYVSNGENCDICGRPR